MACTILPVMRANPDHTFGYLVVRMLQGQSSSWHFMGTHARPCVHYEVSEVPWVGQACRVRKLSVFAFADVFDAILEAVVENLDNIHEPLPSVSYVFCDGVVGMHSGHSKAAFYDIARPY